MLPEGKLKIIEAAKDIIHKHGVQGATMRLVAEAAGVSTGAIYHYFSSKEDILYAVMDHNLSESHRLAESIQSNDYDKQVVLKEVEIEIFKRFNKNEENRIQFYLAQEAIAGNETLKELFQKKYQQWHFSVEGLMSRLYDLNDENDQIFCKHFGNIMLAAIDGILMQEMLGASEIPLSELLKTYDFLLEKGIPLLRDAYKQNCDENLKEAVRD